MCGFFKNKGIYFSNVYKIKYGSFLNDLIVGVWFSIIEYYVII